MRAAGSRQPLPGDPKQEHSGRWWLRDIRMDIGFALRALSRNRAFAATAVGTLALGIAASSVIFALVNGVLLRSLPFSNADELVVIHELHPNYGHQQTSLPDFHDWRDQTTGTFAQMAAAHTTAFNLGGIEDPVQIWGDRVTANFFTLLGVQPLLGRGFRAEEELGAGHNVIVLSHAFWQRQFGGDPNIVNRSIQLSGSSYQVVGVAPANFYFGRPVDFWAPARTDSPDAMRSRGYLRVVARMKPHITIAQAQAAMKTVIERAGERYPETNAGRRSELLSLREDIVANVRPTLRLFVAAVILVLLIACTDVANLLLARAAAREPEIAVRGALGASRSRIMTQLLTESALVGLLGGLFGLLLAMWTLSALRASGTTLIPRLGEVHVDMTLMAFAFGLSLATGLVCGLAPALRLATPKVHVAIREGMRSGVRGAALRFRQALVFAEVTLAVLLLIAAGLLIRSFGKLTQVDPGFNPERVITYQIVLPATRYPSANLGLLYDAILERTRAVPGVRAAAMSGDLPMHDASHVSFTVEGRASRRRDGNISLETVQPFSVSPAYANVMGLRIRRGRFIESADRPGMPNIAVINTEFARRYIPGGRDPIGTRLRFGDSADFMVDWLTIVGVVDVVAQESLDARPYAQVYQPIAQAPRRGVYVSARTDNDPAAVIAGLRGALKAADAELPMNDIQTMMARVMGNVAQPRFSVVVLSAFAAIAVMLAAIGIYSVLSYSVAQRTREIGIRMALGATASDVRRMIVRQGMTPVWLGVGVGLTGGLMASHLMSRLLYGVAPQDPITFVLVGAFVSIVGFVASYLPSRRPTRITPVEAMRHG